MRKSLIAAALSISMLAGGALGVSPASASARPATSAACVKATYALTLAGGRLASAKTALEIQKVALSSALKKRNVVAEAAARAKITSITAEIAVADIKAKAAIVAAKAACQPPVVTPTTTR
jgi:hypothetical protein